jgi:hypothetical protein
VVTVRLYAVLRTIVAACVLLSSTACFEPNPLQPTPPPVPPPQTPTPPTPQPEPPPPVAPPPPAPPPSEPAPSEPPQSAVAPENLRNCGNENELVCGIGEHDRWTDACDNALKPQTQNCGCLVAGPLGGCLIPKLCNVCVNDTRRRASINDFKGSWEDWALRNQRDSLANDEPINWVMRLGTHNSFNSVSDGHRPIVADIVGNFVDAPNQFYTMTDQLRAGARFLAIDAHLVDSRARLCHGGQMSPEKGPFAQRDIQLCLALQVAKPPFPGMRYYANGIKEIRNWLRDNPNEIILFETENRIGGGCDTCVGTDVAPALDPLREYLGDMLFSLKSPGAPSRADGREDDLWPSRRQLLAMDPKRRVIVFDQDLRDSGLTFEEAPILANGGAFPSVFANNQHYFPDCKGVYVDEAGSTSVGGPAVARNREFSAVFEDRTLIGPFTGVGSIDVNAVRGAADCNYSLIALDFFSSTLPAGRDLDLPDFSRQQAAVWSWKFGDRGQNGDCAKLQFGSGRWVSAACSEVHRFACAPPRSESGTDARAWKMLEDDWKVTAGAGTWAQGEAMCAAEYPGYVFSVPVNGWQNRVLLGIGVGAGVSPGDLWLHYTDQTKEGTWVIPRLETFNRLPIADAGVDRTIECGTSVTLDGSASTDPDGDSLTYTWNGPFGTLTGQQAIVTLAPGTHAITLAVSDGKGGADTDAVEIAIADTLAPKISVSLSRSILWPPNHKLREVTASVHVEDACGAELVQLNLDSIVSNEPDGDEDEAHHHHDRHCDHDRSPDIVDAGIGTGDLEFRLRAERSKRGSGRIYTVTYSATDAAGNSVQACARVRVPPDRQHVPSDKGCCPATMLHSPCT